MRVSQSESEGVRVSESDVQASHLLGSKGKCASPSELHEVRQRDSEFPKLG